jgi:secreted trypsin-like serine protease
VINILHNITIEATNMALSKFILLALIGAFTVPLVAAADMRIVGGTDAAVGEYPYYGKFAHPIVFENTMLI